MPTSNYALFASYSNSSSNNVVLFSRQYGGDSAGTVANNFGGSYGGDSAGTVASSSCGGSTSCCTSSSGSFSAIA